jgi:transcription-repair coupling factor (superfamily II helicase)
MRLRDAAEWVARHPDIQEHLSRFDDGALWEGIGGEARPIFVSAAWQKNPRCVLLLVSNYDKALQWQARLGLCGIPAGRIRLLPSGLGVLFEDAAPETSALSDRIGALRQLIEGQPGFIIATAPAALERTLPRDLLEEAFIDIEKGQSYDLEDLVRRLQRLGYEPAEPVRVPGQFSRRGGILDLFPMGHDRPHRIEFFGDDVDGIRHFDPLSQRSIKPVDSIHIAPSRETLLPDHEGITELIRASLDTEVAQLPEEAGERLRELIEGDLQALEQRVFFDRLDVYRPWLQADAGCAVDLLPEDGLLILDEPLELEANAARVEEELGQALNSRAGRGEILHSSAHDFVLPPEHLGHGQCWLALTAFNGAPIWLKAKEAWDAGAASLESYRGQGAALTEAMLNWLNSGLLVVVATDQPSRVKSMLNQVELFPSTADLPESGGGLYLVEGNPAGGFNAPNLGIALVSDHELFGVGRLKLPQRKFNEGVPVSSVLDLKPGDFVVHINFGIGVYQGLVTKSVEGVEKEYLYIEYREPDKLYVPADQLDRIQKYLAPSDAPPKLYKLTGGEWQKTVSKAREDAREFARELISLYASRMKVQRPSFGPDTPWQAEMESTFPWVETHGQVEAIADVKRDMTTDYPMDRLICGDVGFGKTEVAIRAAFKAVQAGKQVAVLCPTTILSEQHYRSFTERMESFSVRLGLLNRFRTAKERSETLADLEAGTMDIIIGTHALLANDLRFKDLGLLVIDEEQKFGVKHKESLKALRTNVDVLTMSATPIPRTLSMALMNIREMSVINDPPPGRLPIRTFVRPFAWEVAVEAILREHARGGQVYFVTHAVQGIQHLAEQIRKRIPSATVAVGHGQMNEKELEPVMVGFIRGEIDILVSTTIVENGLDISNANTLIVESADRFGLSQLYQLRGRVGRSDRQAYAYFLYESRKSLTENAQHRLEALAEFSQLGAGYSLAIRDLQIRGAGDLLGAKQSGQMNAVGYDLYTQLIEAEVEFLKTYADGERPKDLADPLQGLEPLPSIDLAVPAYIPDTYVEDQGQRLYFYKRLMGSRTRQELVDASAEMTDRYGLQPPEVADAVAIIGMRLKAKELSIKQIDEKTERLVVSFVGSFEVPPRLVSLLSRRPNVQFSQDRLIWPCGRDSIHACEACLEAIEEALLEIEAGRAALA